MIHQWFFLSETSIFASESDDNWKTILSYCLFLHIFRGGTVKFPCFFSNQPGCNRALLNLNFLTFATENFLHGGVLWCKMSPTVARCLTKKWTRDYFLGESFKQLPFSMIGRGIFPLTQEKRLGFLKVQNPCVSLLEGYRSWEHWK